MTRWWRALRDPELNSLVERAVASNLDLEIALTRIKEARTQEIVVAGAALPQMEASAGAGRGSGTDSARGRVALPIYAGTNTTGLTEITQIYGVDAGWELDFFGKYRRMLEAAQYDTDAAAEARNAILIAVVAEVARNYVELRGEQARLAVARDNVAREERTVDVAQTRFDRGLTNELDVALAKRQVATLQAQLSPLAATISASQRRISTLLGEYPERLPGELQRPKPIPPTPEKLRLGQPVDLLRRRPDIRQAERELAAATARIGEATADLFPRVSLTAGVGAQGQGLGRTPVVSSSIWSVGPAAYWPLLDFGTLDAKIDIQDLRTHEMLVKYKQTIIAAVEDVDNAIQGYRAQIDRLRSLSNALVHSEQAVNIATERYERGLTDFLYVLDAERQEFELQDQEAVAREAVAVQFITLYKALGGGWEIYDFLPPIRQPEPAIAAAIRRLSTATPPR